MIFFLISESPFASLALPAGGEFQVALDISFFLFSLLPLPFFFFSPTLRFDAAFQVS